MCMRSWSSNIYLMPDDMIKMFLSLREVNERMISGGFWRPWVPRATRTFGNSTSSTQRFVHHFVPPLIIHSWDWSGSGGGAWPSMSIVGTLGRLNIWTSAWIHHDTSTRRERYRLVLLYQRKASNFIWVCKLHAGFFYYVTFQKVGFLVVEICVKPFD